ncbi:rod shape-determining protein MreD [Echinicola sp. CAU 1574]|uniref:Rod shape-determining protein MreD n=1 Tax=Echinicola arenosa TaxID=2774144 RepID=A0ABR9AI69_9BACT|nr:rod shape-determining protein MreD [Echinicola arenosa]MBD8488535.1 rod shape-determining protein MreD [Echinicola arenosa]
MNSKNIISSVGAIVLYFLIQILVLKNLVLFGMAFCFLYIIYLLLLPIEIKTIPLMLIAFILGFAIDIFYDSMGLHTASAVVLAFLRKPWLQVITPTGGYDSNTPPSLLNMGIGWFLMYSLPLILIHQLTFFFIDNIATSLYIPMIYRTLSSTAFTFIIGVIVQVLFYKKRRGI